MRRPVFLRGRPRNKAHSPSTPKPPASPKRSLGDLIYAVLVWAGVVDPELTLADVDPEFARLQRERDRLRRHHAAGLATVQKAMTEWVHDHLRRGTV